MTDIVLVGAGGCMRELVWQIQDQNKQQNEWNIVGYVEKSKPDNGEMLVVGKQRLCYLGDDDFLLQQTEPVNVVVCVGAPAIRKKIVQKLTTNPYIQFPNLILNSAKVCEDVRLGIGCIVSMDTRISTNVEVGNFVFLNTGSMICHDGKLDDYVTLNPDVKLAGNVTVGRECEIGMGTKVIQGIKIGDNVTVGAGAVVIRDIASDVTAVGVPARNIKVSGR